MGLIVLGQTLIFMILIITICMLCKADITDLHLEVIKPGEFPIIIKKDKLYSTEGNDKLALFISKTLKFFYKTS